MTIDQAIMIEGGKDDSFFHLIGTDELDHFLFQAWIKKKRVLQFNVAQQVIIVEP